MGSVLPGQPVDICIAVKLQTQQHVPGADHKLWATVMALLNKHTRYFWLKGNLPTSLYTLWLTFPEVIMYLEDCLMYS